MITLDMRTVILGNTITNFVCLIVLAILWYQNRNKYTGLFYWVIDFVLQFGGGLLIALRGTIPDWASMVLSNSMIVSGTFILYFGLCRFSGKKNAPILKYLVLVVFVFFIFIHIYFVYIHNDLFARSINSDTGILLGCLMSVWLMFKGVNPAIRGISTGTGISLAIIILISLIRISGFLLFPQTTSDFLKSGLFDTLMVMLISAAIVFLVFNLVLMVNKRLYLETKQTEEKLADSEVRYRRLFETAQDAILILNGDTGQIIDANPFIKDLLGYTMEELLGKNLWEIGTFKDTLASKLSYKQLQDLGYVRYDHLPLVSKDGQQISVEVVANSYKVDHRKIIQCNIRDITERKKTLDSLKYQALLLDSVSDSVISTDLESHIVTWNKASENIFGWREEEVIGKRIRDVVGLGFENGNPEESLKSLQEMVKIVYTDGSWRGEQINVRKNGERVNFFATVSLVVDNSGKPIGVVGIYNDITDRKKLERQQELSLKVFQLLNESSEKKKHIHCLLELFKSDGHYEAVAIRLRENDDYPYYLSNGFPQEHILSENRLCSVDDKGDLLLGCSGNPVLECMCGNIICGRFDPLKPFFTQRGSFWTNSTTELLASTTETDRQTRTRNRCNSEGYESVALIPLKSSNAIIGLLQINDTRRNCFTLEIIQYYEGLAQSIGIALAQNQLEESLLASETKYRDLYENAPEAYISSDIKGVINEVNKAALLLFGYSKGEFIVKSRIDLYATESEAKANTLFEMVKSGLSIQNEEMIYKRKDGSTFYGILSATPLLDENVQVVSMRAIVTDITEKKQAEAKILEMESLKIINQAKSELLANVSHELRTPLASIKGFIETLIEPDVKWSKKQQLDYLRSANMEADRLNLLIKDLLDMSRIDSGKLALDKGSYKVSEILDSVSGVLSIVTAKHKLKISGVSDLPAVQVDKGRIGQVITNLVENAVKFSPEGSQIEIITVLQEEKVIVSIKDNGIGMPPEVVEKLFDRFYQAQQVVSGKTKGTGLGLAICKGIIEAHGEKIWVESKISKGSKFNFSLSVVSQ